MKENIELSRHREFGDIISDTFVIIKQNFIPLLKAYLVICGLFLLTSIFIIVFINSRPEQYYPTDTAILAKILRILYGVVDYTAVSLTLFSYLAVYKEKNNQPPTVIEVWGYFRYYFFRVFITQILLAIAMVVGCFLCIFPGIYLAIVFSMAIPAMVMENGSIEYSIRRSFRIIKDNWWFTFGVLLILSIIALMAMAIVIVPIMIIYGGSQWLTGLAMGGTYAVIYAIASQLCKVLYFIPIAATTLVYFTLTEQKEATSLTNKIKLFGKKNPGADQPSTEEY
jgi:hypothetical protein